MLCVILRYSIIGNSITAWVLMNSKLHISLMSSRSIYPVSHQMATRSRLQNDLLLACAWPGPDDARRSLPPSSFLPAPFYGEGFHRFTRVFPSAWIPTLQSHSSQAVPFLVPPWAWGHCMMVRFTIRRTGLGKRLVYRLQVGLEPFGRQGILGRQNARSGVSSEQSVTWTPQKSLGSRSSRSGNYLQSESRARLPVSQI